MLIYLVTVLALVSFVGWMLSVIVERKRGTMAPGPFPLPIVGNTPLVLRNEIDKLAVQLNNQYGDVVQLNVGGNRMFIVSGNQYVKQVLISPNYNVRWMVDEGLKEIGMYRTGLAFNEVLQDWKVQKQFFKNSLGGPFLHQIIPVSIQKATKLVDILNESITQKIPINMASYMQRLTIDIIGQLAFGQEFDTISGNEQELAKCTREFLQAWGYFVLTPPFMFKYISRAKTAKFRKVVKDLSEATKKIIQNRRSAIEKEPYNEELTKDFLGSLLVAKSDEEGRTNINDMLSDNEIQVLVREMLLGGSDTTANSLAFMLYWLAKKPHIQQKILEEFDQVIGRDGILTYENQSKLTYLDQVINETARLTNALNRLSPASTVIPRRALEADKIGEYDVPAGTHILVNLHANNINPEFWENPMEFDPDRFSVDNLKKNSKAKNVFFPFGYGAKGCPGQHMARIEIKGVMWVLLRHFDWKLVRPEEPLESTYNIVNQPKNGELFMYAVTRH